MDRQQEAEDASHSSGTSSTPLINDNSTLSAPLPTSIPTPAQPAITISQEEKQEVTDRILQHTSEIMISGSAAAAYAKIHSPEFERLLLADVVRYIAAGCYSGLLFRKLDELLEKMRGLVRHYATAAEDLDQRSREFAEAASGQGKFRIVGKGRAGGRDWDGNAAGAEAAVLAEAAARDKARADSLRRRVGELLGAVRDNLAWHRAKRSAIHVGIVDKALHQYGDILEELGLAGGSGGGSGSGELMTTNTAPTAITTDTATTATTAITTMITTMITTLRTPPRSSPSDGEPSGLSFEGRYAISESRSSEHSSSGSDTVRG